MVRNWWGTAGRYGMLWAVLAIVACGGDEGAGPGTSPPPVVTVQVAPESPSILEGRQVTLVATPRDANGQALDRPVTWGSSNPAVATVAPGGTVTGVAAGAVTITATSEGKQGTAVVTVATTPVAEVRLSVDDEIQLAWNGSLRIDAVALDASGRPLAGRTITWQSSRPTVATVAADGTIQARGEGVANVTAIVEGHAATVGVRVAPVPVKSVAIDATLDGMEMGETALVAAALVGEHDAPVQRVVTWSSSAPAIASVVSNHPMQATVQALGWGRVTLTATVDGRSATYTFTIAPRPAYDLIYARIPAGSTNSELFTLALDGSNASPVRLNAGNVSREPSPSPDGLRFVFSVSQRDLTTGEPQDDLYLVRRDGLAMQRLTSASGMEHNPRWSPDGSRIVYRSAPDANSRAELVLINPDGSGARSITTAIPGTMTDLGSPAWSPDGRRLAFIGAVNGQHKVWVMDADGSNLRQVTTDAGFDSSPSWSPDGATIAFTRYNTAQPETHGEDLMFVDVATGAVRRLELPGDQRYPAWSPDGQFLAFSATALPGRGVANLYTMRPDGTGIRLRTVNAAWGGGVSPAWIRR